MTNGDISVCDDLDLDQMMFASFPEYRIIISCQIPEKLKHIDKAEDQNLFQQTVLYISNFRDFN